MNGDFSRFLVYLIVFCLLCLVWDDFSVDISRQKNGSITSSYKVQNNQYHHDVDLHRGIPVEVR